MSHKNNRISADSAMIAKSTDNLTASTKPTTPTAAKIVTRTVESPPPPSSATSRESPESPAMT